jgi:tetratricopeptide (TPR) repeat protein
MAARQRALHAAAWLASDQHDFAAATRLFEQSATLRRAMGETESNVDLRINAARQARQEGNYRQSAALLEDALPRRGPAAERTSIGSARLELSFDELGQVFRELGLVLRERGSFTRAAELIEEALRLYQANNDRVSAALAMLGLGDIARDQGDRPAVRRYCEPSLAIFREFGMQWAIGFTLNQFFCGRASLSHTLTVRAARLPRSIPHVLVAEVGAVELGVVPAGL